MRIPLLPTRGEGFQNDPLGTPFWRTGKRKQSYIVWNLGRSFFCRVFSIGFVSCWVPAIPTRGMAPGFVMYSHTLTRSDTTRGSSVQGTSVGRELIHQETWAKWQHESWAPLGCNIPLHWWILSSHLYCSHTQGLLLLFKLVLPVINIWNKTGGA